jgi:hypothetical protein
VQTGLARVAKVWYLEGPTVVNVRHRVLQWRRLVLATGVLESSMTTRNVSVARSCQSGESLYLCQGDEVSRRQV